MKNLTEKIANLPEEIKTALNHGFVFLVTPQLIQHFPARQWQDQEILIELQSRYQEQGKFVTVGAYRVVLLANQPELLVIVP
ncbi:hypothetical protein M2139_002539 [Enterococcus sp. PF1-24]|uniref:hypothetical protein n=1 Tax=unclassified Enterococcus TaxID=2608891 RepID=UPI0024769250|nr:MULTISPECIES: hypothetical protein [unclassified Enterococcus]MDH6365533.1 hypothetical protein [Enterococcus sp. PFB1-1]MDH6402634.1 hypothetical protein [Enterococcus sp. PF1-24]